LKGLEIVLAGGTGGLGAATAELLAQEGARLTLSYRANVERAERLRSLGAIVQADLTVAADRARLLDAAPELYGLVVFAGTPARSETMQQAYEVNCFGPLRVEYLPR
jgi:NAD(P)-dependent dehydrogenase (short-subunit alcohol dehydrogenase family)